jgi:hypothetical protein
VTLVRLADGARVRLRTHERGAERAASLLTADGTRVGPAVLDACGGPATTRDVAGALRAFLAP